MRHNDRMRSARHGVVRYPLIVVCACFAPVATALDGWRFGGHVKYQYTYTDYRADDLAALYGEDPAQDNSLDLRLKGDGRQAPWDFSAHYELLAVAGDSVATRRALGALGFGPDDRTRGLPDDRRQLFDLTHLLIDKERTAAESRLDRLAVGHTTARAAARFGRQAVSWGNGLVFQPLDFINPFSPFVIDKEYKSGIDMLFAQWIPSDRGDVQGIVVPRRDVMTHDLESSESTFAAKYRQRFASFSLELLAAQHYDEPLLGASLARSVGGAVWRLDASVAESKTAGATWLAVTNLDYSWVWAEKNYYGYIEYFHSGFGEADRANYANPNPALAARIARGELFTLARDYLAAGVQVELTPLVNVFASTVRNLNDASHVLQARVVYDWLQNVQAMAGINLPIGARGDEYGGIEVAPGAYSAAGRSAYARIAYYF